MALNPDDPIVRWAAFGRQVELFLEGDIGSYLIGKATAQIQDATAELKVVDPYKAEEVQKLQNRIKVAESIVEWLGEAIKAGQDAIEELKNAQN